MTARASPRVTIFELRRLLREDRDAFLLELDRLIAQASDSTSREFWRAMRKLAAELPR